MVDELVHYAESDAVATLTLDSQHNRNALSRQLVTELFEGLQRADESHDVKVVLVRQAGRVFCSGADLSEATTVGMEEGARRIVALQRLIADGFPGKSGMILQRARPVLLETPLSVLGRDTILLISIALSAVSSRVSLGDT